MPAAWSFRNICFFLLARSTSSMHELFHGKRIGLEEAAGAPAVSGQPVGSTQQTIEDESEKISGQGRFVAPAQVQAAGRADGDSPGRAGKPGKVRGERADGGAARSRGKAADLEYVAARVGKYMTVGTGDGDAPFLGRDRLEALGAQQLRRIVGQAGSRANPGCRGAGLARIVRIVRWLAQAGRTWNGLAEGVVAARLVFRKDLHMSKAGYTLCLNRQPG